MSDNSFPSKAAQNEALYQLSKTLDKIQDRVQAAYLDNRSNERVDMYYRFPNTIGQLRNSHIESIHKFYPDLADVLPILDGLIIARDKIKAMPIVKPVSKAAAKKAEVEIRFAHNSSLKDKLMEEAPRLADDYRRYWERVIADLNTKGAFQLEYKDLNFKDKEQVKLYERADEVCRQNFVDFDGVMRAPHRAKLAAKAKQYGEDMALNWYYKLAGKLGAAVTVSLADDDQSGDVMLSGSVKDKAGVNRTVEVRQQRIFKVSHRGVAFHQFPARIYVDGRFMTEAEFAKQFHVQESK